MPPSPSTPGTVRIGGVPEHFNLPFALAAEAGLPAARGSPEVEWTSVPGGSGAMMKGLLAGDYDAALLLTEAAVAAALSSPHAIRIAGGWVDTPLTWGIHVHPDSPHALPAAAAIGSGTDPPPPPRGLPLDQSTRRLTWGISRPHSGSHTLALLHTRGHPHPPSFVTCGNMDGLLVGIADQTIDVFLWERATTAPAVEAGRVALAGTVVPGWPAFCVAVCANASVEVVRAVQAAVATAAVASGNMLAAAEGDAARTDGGGGGEGHPSPSRVAADYGPRAAEAVRAGMISWRGQGTGDGIATVSVAAVSRAVDALVGGGVLPEGTEGGRGAALRVIVDGLVSLVE
ncbi:hypothetical protein MMPV_007123 [Pyropia vietnamensis]